MLWTGRGVTHPGLLCYFAATAFLELLGGSTPKHSLSKGGVIPTPPPRGGGSPDALATVTPRSNLMRHRHQTGRAGSTGGGGPQLEGGPLANPVIASLIRLLISFPSLASRC